MTIEEILEAVRAWQSSEAHPVTCGAQSRHRPLEPVVEGDLVVIQAGRRIQVSRHRALQTKLKKIEDGLQTLGDGQRGQQPRHADKPGESS